MLKSNLEETERLLREFKAQYWTQQRLKKLGAPFVDEDK